MMAEIPVPVAVSFRRQVGRADYRSDLAAVDKPLLVIHGDRDASAPLYLTGEHTARAVSGARLLVYHRAPHALPLTHRARFHQDMLAFAQGG
jgi:pimeloyl-ACP methyl ester carboxylesterase